MIGLHASVLIFAMGMLSGIAVFGLTGMLRERLMDRRAARQNHQRVQRRFRAERGGRF